MQKSFLLGVSVGESFAEYSLLSDSQPLAQKRVYLSRENLKQSLRQFVSEHAEHKPQHAFVTLRLPKRLLDFRLSGAVAHITTEGFEHWLNVRGPREFTNKDLLFSIRERILADGKVDVPLNLEELEVIAAKLIAADVKKICLHFLHASTNPIHAIKAHTFLQEKGFEVFMPDSDTPDEVMRWSQNALNATISGIFADRKAEIISALEEVIDSQQVHFLNSSAKPFSKETSQEIESLFSASTSIGLTFSGKDKADVLYLGLENFLLISGSQWSPSWESPWGPVAVSHLQTKTMGTQPTLGITLNSFGRFDFDTEQIGWEPGPMFLGRGQRLSFLDLWAENNKLTKLHGLGDRFSPQGIQRFKNAFFALSKISQTRNNDVGHMMKEMQSLALQKLALEAILHRQSEKMIVTGPLASVFANVFKNDPQCVVNNHEFSESHATALCGFQALRETL